MRKKKIEGQAMVEFALVLPILIMLICGIIDFGWIFGNQILVNNATREAARDTAIHYSEFASQVEVVENAESIVEAKAQILKNVGVTVTLTAGENVTLSVEGTIPLLTPLTSIFMGETYAMKAKSVMRLE